MTLQAEWARLPATIVAVLLAPITFTPSLVLALWRVKLVRISRLDRVGHLAIEIDAFLKDVRLGKLPRCRPILVQRDDAPPANRTLLEYWRPFIAWTDAPALNALLRLFWIYPWLRFRASRYAGTTRRTALCYATEAAWGDRPPLLELTPDHIARGETELHRLGLPEGAWFVCVHTREAGYSPADDAMHAYRNSPIESYRLAMEAVVARGGWCIRVGDASGAPMTPMAGVIDYAHSAARSDWMDVFLCAECRFFLGNSSGLFMVPTIFGVPVALAHMTPLGCVYALGAHDLSIPKPVVDSSGKMLTFAEVAASPAGDFRDTREFMTRALRVIDNAPEEIRDLAVEMMDRLEGRATYDASDRRMQESFRKLIRPGHYSYGSQARVGRDYLRLHRELL